MVRTSKKWHTRRSQSECENNLGYYIIRFRKDHSTELAILEIRGNPITAIIDNNLITCVFFLDFSKAFDTVMTDPHMIANALIFTVLILEKN